MRQRSALALQALLDENQLRLAFELIWIKKSITFIHLVYSDPIGG